MYRPPADFTNFESLADWIEACSLYSNDGEISRDMAADILRDEGLIGSSKKDFFEGDNNYNNDLSFSDEDSTSNYLDDVWQVLYTRRSLLKSKDTYPFELAGQVLKTKAGSWKDYPSYATLLLADLWKSYKLNTVAEENFPRLFEKIVEASGSSIFGGRCVRFGVPTDPGWPTSINDRIKYLGDLMNLEEEILEGKTNSSDQDRGLDVISRLGLGDDGPGTLIILIQCATGKHWRNKTGEPSIANWRDLLRWNASLQRAIAIPFRLDTKEKATEHKRFDAIIMDRFRLLSANPDGHLAQHTKESLLNWCLDAIKHLPLLG